MSAVAAPLDAVEDGIRVVGGAHLGNSAERSERGAKRTARIASRWSAQSVARKALAGLSPTEKDEGFRIRYCGITACGTADTPDVSVRVRASGKLDVLGVMTCESRWVCPCCAQQSNLRDALRSDPLVKAHLEKGCVAEFITFTVPSRPGDSLDAVIKAVRDARNVAVGQGSWRYITGAAKYRASVRKLEITRGCGWHVHLHEVWLFDITAKDVATWDDSTDCWRKRPNTARPPKEFIEHRTFRKALHQDLFDAWKFGVRKIMHRTPHHRFSVDINPLTLDNCGAVTWYVAGATDDKDAKGWSPMAELNMDTYKTGRLVEGDDDKALRTRSMWQVLEDIVGGPDEESRDAALRDFREYAMATHNVTQFTFPLEYAVELGVCTAAGDLIETSDEVVEDDETVTRILLPVDAWNQFAAASPIAPVGRIAARWAETEGDGDVIDRILSCFKSLGWSGYWGPSPVLRWAPPYDETDVAREPS